MCQAENPRLTMETICGTIGASKTESHLLLSSKLQYPSLRWIDKDLEAQ